MDGLYYSIVCNFVAYISKTFGLILLLITGNDLLTAILKFDKLLLFFNQSPLFFLQFMHDILRFFVILKASQRIKSEVRSFASETRNEKSDYV